MTMPVVEANPTVRVGMDEQRHIKNLVILFAESVGRAVPGEDATGRDKRHSTTTWPPASFESTTGK